MSTTTALPVFHGRDRYAGDWPSYFETYYRPYLRPGVSILDVGSGKVPAIKREELPVDSKYVGLDISGSELDAAPTGSYDRGVVGDLTEHVPELVETADLILSLHVLEHVAPIDKAIDNMHAYLREGGYLVALFSGRNAYFSALNRAIPHKAAVKAMELLLHRPPHSVFPAYYDRCTHTELSGLLSGWSEANIIPLFRGAYYWKFLPPVQAAYLRVEDWLERANKRDLATHYVIVARK